MKYPIGIFFLFIVFLSFGQRRVIDKVVAQVGANHILLSDIELQKSQMKQTDSTLVINREMECGILNEMVYQNLLLLQADIDSVTVADAQVDAEMENRIRVIEHQIGGRDKLEAFYGKSVNQIKKEFREAIRKRLIVDQMEEKITGDLDVTPDEISTYYHKIPFDSLPLINSEVKIQQLTVFPTISAQDKKDAREKLQRILDDIRNGKSFESEAKAYSEDPGSAAKGGIMEATMGMMVPAFENVILSLEEGQVSEIFETEYGYHIAKLLKRNGNDYVCSHILIIPTFNRDELVEANNQIEEAYRKLKNNEITWDQAVLTYSNDENTKSNYGILSNPYTGEQYWKMEDLNQIDQQMFRLIDNMQIGDFSAPSLYFDINEKKQGIRIVRIADRTKPHRANLQDDYGMVQTATKAWKKQQLINRWTKKHIQDAYIRLDPDYQSCDITGTDKRVDELLKKSMEEEMK